MKQREITKCLGCGEGVCRDNIITFYRIHAEHLIVDLGAVRRQTGLELLIGNAAIAAMMGPDDDLAVVVSEVEGLLCQACAIRHCIASLVELVPRKAEAAEQETSGSEGRGA